jgi:DNA primase
MAGIFQVYAIEGKSTGTKDGFLLTLEDGKKLIFDGDFAGFEAADAKYKKLIDDAVKEGFWKKAKIAGE